MPTSCPAKRLGFSFLNQLTELHLALDYNRMCLHLVPFLKAFEQAVIVTLSESRQQRPPESLKLNLERCIISQGSSVMLNKIPQLMELSLPARQTVTRLSHFFLTTKYVPNFADLSNFFPSLTTISLHCFLQAKVFCVALFAALAQLKHLFHLCLKMEFTQENQKSEFSSLHLNPLLSL